LASGIKVIRVIRLAGGVEGRWGTAVVEAESSGKAVEGWQADDSGRPVQFPGPN